jgi:hypothetical protein
MPTTQIRVEHLFVGRYERSTIHHVSTARGLRRVVAASACGNGWGIRVMMPCTHVLTSSVYEMMGGGLRDADGPICEGSLYDPDSRRPD